METIEKKFSTENSNEVSEPNTIKTKLTFWGFIKKHPTFTTIIVALLSIGAVILYKDASHAKWQKEMTEKASNQLFNTQEDLIKLVAKPLVWNIRAEMLRNNMEQVSILMTDMVRDNTIQYVHLIDTNGLVLLSTNKKLEGQIITNEFDSSLLKTTEPTTLVIENIVQVAAPVMGVDRQLGVLILGYQPTMLVLE